MKMFVLLRQVENLDEENNSEDEGIDDYKIGG